ncbi:conserved hypothetical protein [Chlorobaculum parvum NCIB 8327]|uniref:Uncharacterized protein n=1 Tax=Chlorobaculum parvum (strain DSM 263 / NCIMB 8327) TaxID=517417 RepID=B3QL75_CHLP8|nr:hypothetical protein [Chlorobaculum parvum]ACF12313.1 conserved hypothetical protein [Chlorobaculum parvum NCIB 8327]
MKLLAVMGHEETRPLVRELFKKHRVNMFSNISIRGCNCQPSDFESQSWWPADESIGAYSSLCFAILEDDKAVSIMEELESKPVAVEPNFPARAFLMNVEKTA